VILRIEDFSVEDVRVGIPGEEELIAPERSIPLPEAEELEIEEPELPFSISEGRDLVSAERESGLSAQAVLGAGTLSHLYSLISLNRIGGEEPRFKLRFLHEMLDGTAGIEGQSPGSGFHTREDTLEGGIKLHLGKLGLEVEGLLQDQERGLQDNGSPYLSRVYRQGTLDAKLDLPVGERLHLDVAAGGSFSSELLTGMVPEDATEVLAYPLLKLEYRREKTWLGLEGRYKYRDLLGTSETSLQRSALSAFFGAEFSTDYRLEAEAGWVWNSGLDHLFPFSLIFYGTPFSSFSFQAGGGYRVEELDYRDILGQYPVVDYRTLKPPLETLQDSRGWFADLGLSFTISRNLSLQARALLGWNSAMLMPDVPVIDPKTGLPTTGLFSISQQDGVQLATDARLRWNLGTMVTVSTGLHSEILDRPDNSPLHAGLVEIEGTNASGRWGGKGGLSFAFGYDPGVEVTLMPELSLSGFYNITDTVTLSAELEDILYPFPGERWLMTELPSGLVLSWFPYQAPGLRGIVKVQINL